jgi:membrane-bound lytic murein transglycosylase F
MKKVIFITGSFALVLLVVLLVITRNQHHRDLSDILTDGRITVLIDSGEHGFTRDSTKVYGFQYEVVKRFADEMGVELVILQEPDHNKGNKELLEGDCDILVSLQPLVQDSGQQIVSAFPLVATNLMLVQLPDSAGNLPVSTQYELDSCEIVVVKASPFSAVLSIIANDLAISPVISESQYTALDDIVKRVASGEVAYTVCPAYLTKRLQKRYPTVDMTLPLTFHLQLGWTVRSSSVELKGKLDEFIRNFVETADYQTLFNTYFELNN